MRTVRRSLCVLFVASAVVAGCGDDEDDAPTTIPTTTAPSTVAPAPSTTVPGTIARNVTDGAVCSPVGARGTTQNGIPLVCVPIAGGNELRWRPE